MNTKLKSRNLRRHLNSPRIGDMFFNTPWTTLQKRRFGKHFGFFLTGIGM